MSATEDKLTKEARKNYTCNWCYQTIQKGEPYWSWFTYRENVTARMHPECYDAMLDADIDDELPPAGTYRRGCSCGENEEFCKCPGARKDGEA